MRSELVPKREERLGTDTVFRVDAFKMQGNRDYPQGFLERKTVSDVRNDCPHLSQQIEEQSRFVPVTVDGWTGQHTINVPPLPKIDITDAPAPLENLDTAAAAPIQQ